MLAFALMKAVEIIGEAAAKISRNARERFNEIPWSEIIGMRKRLTHAYDQINLDVLWQTVTANLPPFIQTLERIIASEWRR
ncbi:MAG: HepT-like ribonuclease domain-containing protein [Thermodesulfobacteriota bacterium]